MFVIIPTYIARLRERKQVLMVYIFMSVIAIIAGLYLSDQTTSYRIAVTGSIDKLPVVNKAITLESVPSMVKESELVLQRYDGAVLVKKDGSMVLKSTKNAEEVKFLEAAMQGKDVSLNSHKRGKGTTILGYVMMFVMMQSIAYLMLFGEDKEHHMLERLQATPLSSFVYVVTMITMATICTMMPSFLCLCVAWLLGFSIGFTLPVYFVLLLLLSLLAVSIAFLMNTFIYRSDSANMVTSAIFVLSSVLSGCFLSLSGTWAETISNYLPQHQLLAYSQALEQGSSLLQEGDTLFYLLGCILLCFGIGVIGCRRIFLHRA